MNLAGIWKLPVIFVCENNQYAISTPVTYATAGPGISARAAGYGFPGCSVDGMDVLAVREATARALDRARKGEGPTLIECKTYRFQGHFTAERALGIHYRDQEEIEKWRLRDPIEGWARRLEEAKILNQAQRAELDQQTEELLDEAVQYARLSHLPDPGEVLEDMYVVRYPDLPAKGSAWTAK